MKNFLIIVLALGLTAAAFATRPDREDFDRYLAKKQKTDSTAASLQPIAIFRKAANSSATANAVMTSAVSAATSSDGKEPPVVIDPAKVEFKDCFLWTVVKQDGKTLYTGVFAHWIDNQQVRGMLPS